MDETSGAQLATLRRLAAIAQSGLHYSKDPYDQERYSEMERVVRHLLSSWSGVKVEELSRALPTRPVPATPILDVRAAVIVDDTILLVREADGRWSLPGGWAEVNESPSESVEREVFEESGIECRATRVLAIWDRDRHDHPPFALHCYKLVFSCEVLGRGAFRPNVETSDAGFFSIAALPDLSTGRITHKQIASLFESVRSNLPTRFD